MLLQTLQRCLRSDPALCISGWGIRAKLCHSFDLAALYTEYSPTRGLDFCFQTQEVLSHSASLVLIFCLPSFIYFYFIYLYVLLHNISCLLWYSMAMFLSAVIPNNSLISLPSFSCRDRFLISSSECHGFLLYIFVYIYAVWVYPKLYGRVCSFRLGVFTGFWTHMSSLLSFEKKSNFLPVFCCSFCV